MKVLIVSDTHGRDHNLLEVLEREKNLDFMVHLGDFGKLDEYIEEISGLACFMVRGNNDFRSFAPAESVIMLGRHRTLITHGHLFNVYSGSDTVAEYAKSLECDIVMYGHTHVPSDTFSHGVRAINPGSLTSPRQPGHAPSYVIAHIDDNGEPDFTIRYLD